MGELLRWVSCDVQQAGCMLLGRMLTRASPLAASHHRHRRPCTRPSARSYVSQRPLCGSSSPERKHPCRAWTAVGEVRTRLTESQLKGHVSALDIVGATGTVRFPFLNGLFFFKGGLIPSLEPSDSFSGTVCFSWRHCSRQHSGGVTVLRGGLLPVFHA